jgi:hypothetical protein
MIIGGPIEERSKKEAENEKIMLCKHVVRSLT